MATEPAQTEPAQTDPAGDVAVRAASIEETRDASPEEVAALVAALVAVRDDPAPTTVGGWAGHWQRVRSLPPTR